MIVSMKGKRTEIIAKKINATHFCTLMTPQCLNSISGRFLRHNLSPKVGSYHLQTHRRSAHIFFSMIPSYFKIEILVKRSI